MGEEIDSGSWRQNRDCQIVRMCVMLVDWVSNTTGSRSGQEAVLAAEERRCLCSEEALWLCAQSD